MTNLFSKLSPFAPLVLRLTISFVMLWFGLNQVLNPESWTGFVPAWITDVGFDPVTFIYLNGAAEIILGSLLALGIATRVIAFLLFLHMTGIVIEVGLTPIGVRDIGLAGALLFLSLHQEQN
ncbi:MAG: DoxX family membrane protein [Patescibacteria group bacterium]